jgi:hypothetical protein
MSTSVQSGYDCNTGNEAPNIPLQSVNTVMQESSIDQKTSRLFIEEILDHFLEQEDEMEKLLKHCVHSIDRDDTLIFRFLTGQDRSKFMTASERQLAYEKGGVSAEDQESIEASWVSPGNE